MAKGFGLGGLLVILLSAILMLPANLLALWMGLFLCFVAALGGDKAYPVAGTMVASAILLFLSPATLVAIGLSAAAGTKSGAAGSLFYVTSILMLLPIGGVIFRSIRSDASAANMAVTPPQALRPPSAPRLSPETEIPFPIVGKMKLGHLTALCVVVIVGLTYAVTLLDTKGRSTHSSAAANGSSAETMQSIPHEETATIQNSSGANELLANETNTEAAAITPSFDCARATVADEKAICANQKLTLLEASMALTVATLKERQPKVDEQHTSEMLKFFLEQRHGCGGDEACIRNVLNGEIAWLSRRIYEVSTQTQP